MFKRIILVILFLSIILLPAYALADKGSSKGDSKDKAGSQSCDQKNCDQQCPSKDCCCDKCKEEGCGKDCKCKCHEGMKCECSKEGCGKDCKCKCHEGQACDGKCKEGKKSDAKNKTKSTNKANETRKSKRGTVVIKKEIQMPCIQCEGSGQPAMKGEYVSMAWDGRNMMMLKPVNPLDREARTFIEQKVKRIAIVPFSDYTVTSAYGTKSFETWASRRINDYLSAEFVKIGKLVVPYDVMTTTLAQVKTSPQESKGEAPTFQKQLAEIDLSSEVMAETMKAVYGTGLGMASANQMIATSLSSDEVKALGKALGVQAIIMGAISDYGTKRHIKADVRTFIPPFLGLWNPSKKSAMRMMVYLYDTETGEMIWESMEEVSREPTFPLFSNEEDNYDYINQKIAENIVNHFRDMFIPMPHYAAPPKNGGPGTTRREKNIHEIIKH